MVSIQRINCFVNADQINEKAVNSDNKCKTPVLIERANFAWTKSCSPVLKNISLEIKKNQLVAVVGRVGSGKTSLLSALLGELEKLDGNVCVNGSIAYVPQQPWVQNKTLRDNITFINEYNTCHYNQVLDSCALKEDLKVLSAGDMTEIGEKGINLSGGQKQRVSLARAVYSNADIYLLDDPLR